MKLTQDFAEGFVTGMLFATSFEIGEESEQTTEYEEWQKFFDGQTAGSVAEIEKPSGPQTAAEAVEWVRDRHTVGIAHVSYTGPDEKNPYVLPSVTELPDGWKRNEGDSQRERNYLVKQ